MTLASGLVIGGRSDFGICKLNEGASGLLTSAGRVMGKPCYMAPEQALAARDIDARADLQGACEILRGLLDASPVRSWPAASTPPNKHLVRPALLATPATLVLLVLGGVAFARAQSAAVPRMALIDAIPRSLPPPTDSGGRR